jgi:hypothetical protein
MNSLELFRSSQYHVYVDDFQFYAADDISNVSLCLERVNSDLDAIYRWSPFQWQENIGYDYMQGSGLAAFSCAGIET